MRKRTLPELLDALDEEVRRYNCTIGYLYQEIAIYEKEAEVAHAKRDAHGNQLPKDDTRKTNGETQDQAGA